MARISEGGNIQKPTKQRTAQQFHPPFMRIIGRMDLDGIWNIRRYEYDDTFERLQLHKSGTKDFQGERHAGEERRHMTEDEVVRCQRYLTADEAEKRRINQMITDQFAGNDSWGSEESVEDEEEGEPDEEVDQERGMNEEDGQGGDE